MKNSILFIATFFFALNICGQEFNSSINKDSLFQTILKKLPEGNRSRFSKIYNEGKEQEKEFLLFVFSMGASSKKELIANIDSNFDKINYLKAEYSKLVPKGYIVSIEFNPENKIVNTKESIDLKIEKLGSTGPVDQDWNLEYNSDKLNQMTKPLNWTNETLKIIKKLLVDANCVSIENGETTIIGFARSGMGKYSFVLFDNDLTKEESKNTMTVAPIFFTKKILF